MLRIENITDVNQLKQVALLLEEENKHLHKRIEEMSSELARLKGQDKDRQLSFEIEKLQTQMTKTPETKPHRLKIRFNRELHRQTPVQTGFKRELQ